MRLKLDENIPASLVPALAALGHDVHTVVSEGIQGVDDALLWQIAQAERRFVITQDIRFVAQQAALNGPHFGILIVRTRFPGRIAVHDRILGLFRCENVQAWSSCVVVASDVKVRVVATRS